MMGDLLLDYGDLVLGVLNVVVVLVLLVQLGRLRLGVGGPAAAVLAYFAMRAFARLIDSPQIPPGSRSDLAQVIDAVSIVTILYLLLQTGRLVTAFRLELRQARLREEEYDRARRHYTQVVRHRVMNPLTVIEGTLYTLRDGVPVDDDTRRSMCCAALDASRELRELSLEPERRDALEHELDALPNPRPESD